ncbi:ABC transporter substrate-binding protein [Rhodobacteraceae bacterium MCCB 386]|nr:ABC transporter substrate-binding protein [Roseitranquillus sediminis]MBM9593051.1 ABC transporter substrate-binding protein [Roseitranquillus sediminis]
MTARAARRIWAWLRASSAALALAAAPVAAAPERVVSMNLCTDQLALMLAAPGQLLSVSALSQDPRSSAMAEAARRLPANHGRAEEVFLMRPDLVLAGSYTTPATRSMLSRLGIRVETLPPAASLDEVRSNLRTVGRLLGREVEAEAMVAEFDADLAALAPAEGERPDAALYQAQGYASGPETLAGEILAAAGFDNAAAAAGVSGGAFLPLEVLVTLAPDLVVSGGRQPGASRAEEVLDHPALRALHRSEAPMGSDWVCGTPHVLAAVERLSGERRALAH